MSDHIEPIREALLFGRDCGSRFGEYDIMDGAIKHLDALAAELRAAIDLLGGIDDVTDVRREHNETRMRPTLRVLPLTPE